MAANLQLVKSVVSAKCSKARDARGRAVYKVGKQTNPDPRRVFLGRIMTPEPVLERPKDLDGEPVVSEEGLTVGGENPPWLSLS